MIGLLLLCTGLITAAPEAGAADRVAYQAAKAQAGRDPEAHVRLALWCEARGLLDVKMKHLAMAALADPNDARVRGLMGLVAYRGRWERPEAIDAKIKADRAMSARLAEYNARRAKLDRDFKPNERKPGHRASPARVGAHIILGEWCESVGLKSEAMAHYTTAVVLDPSRVTAWWHLGYTRQEDGRWRTPQQVAAEKAEAEAQQRADDHWGPLLKKWRSGLTDPFRREEAVAALAEIRDPRAVPAIASVFVHDPSADREVGVGLLGRIDSAASTKELAALAIEIDDDRVRSAAIAVLRGRDLRDFARDLVETIHAPMRYWVEPVRGPGSPGALVIETTRYRMLRTYDAPPVFRPGFLFRGYVGYDSNGLPVIEDQGEKNELAADAGLLRSGVGGVLGQGIAASMAREQAWIEARTARLITAANLKALASQNVLIEDIQAIERTNAGDAARNERIIDVLRRTLDAPDLKDDEDAWHRWYFDRIGYTYTPPRRVTLAVDASPQPPAPTTSSCFVAGTLVRTRDGRRPIEGLGVGDQVLSQDAATGALAFRSVTFLHRNPPVATLRIALDSGEVVVASTYHRFWLAGRGWRMARELAAGDALRTLGGPARIASISPGRVEPVFNLDVDRDHTYFVGRGDALVHDNTLPEAHAPLFDAPATLGADGSLRRAGGGSILGEPVREAR